MAAIILSYSIICILLLPVIYCGSSFALNLCYKNYRYHKCYFKLHPLLESRICFPTPIPFSFLISPTRYKVCTIQIIFNKILLFVAEAWIHTSPPLLAADWVVSFWSIHYWTLVLISYVSRDNCFSANMFDTLTIWTEGDVPCRPPGFPHISVLLPVLKETGRRMIMPKSAWSGNWQFWRIRNLQNAFYCWLNVQKRREKDDFLNIDVIYLELLIY